MIIFATVKMALRALRRNMLRTLLTMLGIIFGVGAVIAMVALGNGTKARMQAQIASMGQNVITVFSGNVNRGGFSMGFGNAPSLTREDYDAIRNEVPGVAGVSPEVRANAQIAAGNQNQNTQISGVSEDYIEIRSWPLSAGADFTESDIRGATKVALIGATTAKSLFGDADPVGQIIRIKSAPFKVVGVLSSKGMSMNGFDQDDIVLVPYTSAMVRLTGQTSFRNFNVQAADPAIVPAVQESLTELLRQRHRVGPDKEDDFIIRTQQEVSEVAEASAQTMTLFLGAIAGVSLLVGGIGIMNIMLVSVTERTREIGVRLSVGARGRDILLQFLIEAVTLSVVGGVLGIASGYGGARAFSAYFGWATFVSANSISIAFAFSVAIGIFFGFYPAWKAAQMDPIDALRHE